MRRKFMNRNTITDKSKISLGKKLTLVYQKNDVLLLTNNLKNHIETRKPAYGIKLIFYIAHLVSRGKLVKKIPEWYEKIEPMRESEEYMKN